MHARYVLTTATLLTLVACGETGQAGAGPAGEATAGSAGVVLHDGLGDHHHEITTDDPMAQRYFDQGVRLAYAFDHAEAEKSFREAARRDPSCAMCWWGVAWVNGPNINGAMDSAGGADAWAAVRKARERAGGATERERAYIEAMAARYGPDPLADRAGRDSAYAEGMHDVVRRFPDDAEARVLFAAARMNLRPWDYWTPDEEPKPGVPALLDALEGVIREHPEHPGGCHYYIHAVEAAHPERALACAERLPKLMPGAGHVVHMPAHVYIRTGRYEEAIEANQHAVHADASYLRDRRPGGAYELGYHPHNWHFLSFAASMAGKSGQALEAAGETAARVDSAMLHAPGFGALQHYLATPLRVMIRFGRWEEILAEPPPAEDLLYPRGTWHYARAVAYARTGRPTEAADELARLREIAPRPELEEVKVWGLNSAAALLGVAVKVAEGEVAAARGDHGAAVEALREGIERELVLIYDEPPPWHLPVRHVLGAVLLEADRPAQAEATYREALERFPANGWALHGLAASLEAQGKEGEAQEARARFEEAWRLADVEIPGSRF